VKEKVDTAKPHNTAPVISLILPIPPSSNRYWRIDRRGFVYLSEEAKAYKRDLAFIAGIKTPIYSEVKVSVKVYRPQRSGDLDNRLKILLDALQGVVFASDKQVSEIHAYRFEDKNRPRVEVEIEASGLF